MKIYKYGLLALLSIVALNLACKKLPDGYIGDGIRYEETPIIIQQGRIRTSTALNVDGSSQPMTIKVIHFYDKATGKIVDDIFAKQFKIKIWTAVFDPLKDTTVALVQAKQRDSLVNPIHINSSSGQIEANYTSMNVPLGSYQFDLEITNPAGTKVYPKIGSFDVVTAPAFEIPTVASNGARMVGDETKNVNLKAPIVTVNKIADNENKVILKYTDKNGVVFNPAAGEIVYRPQPGLTTGSLQTMKMYAMKTELLSNRTEFTFGTTPFPLVSLGNGFNYYYRIPTQFLHFDNPLLADNKYSANPRFSFQSFQPGVYEVTVKLPDVTHR